MTLRLPRHPLLPLACGLLLVGCGGGGTEPSAPATALAIATQPTGASSGSALLTQPVIRVVDAGGAVVHDAATVVTASIASGTGTLAGTTTTTAINGVATFSDLRVTGAGAHSLRFSAGTLTPAVSSAFTIVGPPANVAFATGRAIVDAGATTPTAIEVRDAAGTILSGTTLTFTSRDPSVATVDGSGTITGVAKGQTVVVASIAGSTATADSLLAVVATPGGPVLYTSLNRFTADKGTTLIVSVYLDMRGSAKKLSSGQLDVRFTPAQLTYTTTSSLRFVPQVNSSGAATGLVRLSFADPNGAVGPSVEIARFTFSTASTAGTAGVLELDASELTASDYSDLLASAMQVTQPLVLR
jgi:hypothetical protein